MRSFAFIRGSLPVFNRSAPAFPHGLLKRRGDDIAAAREYAKLPLPMRHSFGAMAEEAEDLDRYLKRTRQDRYASARRTDDLLALLFSHS